MLFAPQKHIFHFPLFMFHFFSRVTINKQIFRQYCPSIGKLSGKPVYAECVSYISLLDKLKTLFPKNNTTNKRRVNRYKSIEITRGNWSYVSSKDDDRRQWLPTWPGASTPPSNPMNRVALAITAAIFLIESDLTYSTSGNRGSFFIPT